MHGLGNDFVIVWGEQALPERASELAQRLCHRQWGIGADGLVFILPSEIADFRMRIINSDGSEAEQCGNAIRCVAKYVYERKLTDKAVLTIETLGAGAQTLQLEVVDGHVANVRVDMGEPILNGRDVPVALDGNPVLAAPVTVDGREFAFTAVSMGNPHAVIFVDDAVHFDVEHWGALLEVHPLFPAKTNVEFASVRDSGWIDMRVWERGAGATWACGTGACATLVAAHLNGLIGRSATISLRGGELQVEWNEQDNHVYMTGPASEVFSGEVAAEMLEF
jgi:diaminopimelate epimerase